MASGLKAAWNFHALLQGRRSRIGGCGEPQSQKRSIVAVLAERLAYPASSPVRRRGRAVAVAIAVMAASVPGVALASPGCDYLDGNALSSIAATTLTGDFNTNPNPSLSAPTPFTAGAANFASGDTVQHFG